MGWPVLRHTSDIFECRFVNVFVFVFAYIVFSAIKATIGLRLSKEGETKGTDVTETGVIAYAIRD